MPNHHFPLLEQMLADMASADALYRPTNFWQVASEQILQEIEEHGIGRFKSLPMPLTFFVPTYSFPGYYQDTNSYETVRSALTACLDSPTRALLRLEHLMSGREQAIADYRVFLTDRIDQAPFLDRVSESQVGEPLEQFEFDGRRLSRPFLNYLLGISFIKRHCDIESLGTVLEIGGGHGCLGEIVLGDSRNNGFYIDVDIPPTAFFATWYLQEVFGREAIADHESLSNRETIEIEELRRNYRGAVICPWRLPDLQGNIDLFVNFVSFQEMEPPVVENYLSLIQKLSPRYVLLRNLREGKQIAKNPGEFGVETPILGADYDSFLDRYSLLATNVLPYGHLTEDGFHSELRIYQRD